jgi:hypothetical protein
VTIDAGENEKKEEHSSIVGEIANWYNHSGSYKLLFKIFIKLFVYSCPTSRSPHSRVLHRFPTPSTTERVLPPSTPTFSPPVSLFSGASSFYWIKHILSL